MLYTYLYMWYLLLCGSEGEDIRLELVPIINNNSTKYVVQTQAPNSRRRWEINLVFVFPLLWLWHLYSRMKHKRCRSDNTIIHFNNSYLYYYCYSWLLVLVLPFSQLLSSLLSSVSLRLQFARKKIEFPDDAITKFASEK